MAEKWTPGPWARGDVMVVRDGDYYEAPHEAVIYCDNDDNEIHIEGSDARSNARLIAAAPELYAALSDLVYAIACNELMPESVSYLREARAALAKARGE